MYLSHLWFLSSNNDMVYSFEIKAWSSADYSLFTPVAGTAGLEHVLRVIILLPKHKLRSKIYLKMRNTENILGQAVYLAIVNIDFCSFSLSPHIAFHPLRGYPRSRFFMGTHILTQLDGLCKKTNLS